MSQQALVVEVASRLEAGDILCSDEGCTDVICLISIGEPHDELPFGFENIEQRVRLQFADIVEGPSGPREEDVRHIIELAGRLQAATGKVLIHCEAGVSRSSAAALIMYACWLGPGCEEEALQRVVVQRPIACPNKLMVALADRLLERKGRLLEVVTRYAERGVL